MSDQLRPFPEGWSSGPGMIEPPPFMPDHPFKEGNYPDVFDPEALADEAGCDISTCRISIQTGKNEIGQKYWDLHHGEQSYVSLWGAWYMPFWVAAEIVGWFQHAHKQTLNTPPPP